ncbi:hypothetical protein [Inhella sp.]|uniref:hypothetical protein n=1 Tax=Inhella sp. TaxID=1921806 RepID=UPI0035AFF10C
MTTRRYNPRPAIDLLNNWLSPVTMAGLAIASAAALADIRAEPAAEVVRLPLVVVSAKQAAEPVRLPTVVVTRRAASTV